jgi:hypothetical protein
MNDPERLCDGDDPAAKRLVLAMREERAPSGAAQRALLALGVAGSAVAATTGAAGAGATVGPSTLWLAALKWLGGGVALGLAIGGGASLIAPPEANSNERAPLAVNQTPGSAPTGTAAPRAAEQPALSEAEPPPPPTSTARSKPPVPLATAPAVAAPGIAPTASFGAPEQDALAREVELLDRARQALGGGDANGALASLDRFAREFPRGRLSAEAFVVRLQALTRAGRTAEARALAERHLAAHPTSPHAQRIREITGLGAPR